MLLDSLIIKDYAIKLQKIIGDWVMASKTKKLRKIKKRKSRSNKANIKADIKRIKQNGILLAELASTDQP
jgi:hypothetical protein